MRQSIYWLATAVLVLAAGCATPPELAARSKANPVGTDLSGNWDLRDENGEPGRRQVEREQGIRLPPASAAGRRSQTSRQPAGGRRSKGPSVQVFIEYGSSLKLTQTDHGLFVSFDRAVVEEYTFGENRTIALGPIEAQRVSGWEGTVFVVETMDEQGTVLTETWALDADGQELVRDIAIVDDDEPLYSLRQIFDRS